MKYNLRLTGLFRRLLPGCFVPANDHPAPDSSSQNGIEEVKPALADTLPMADQVQVILDTTPLCCVFWDEKGNCVACNAEAPRLFGLKSKEDFLSHCMDLCPEFQPCGRRSRELAKEKITEAFAEGRILFEWQHQDVHGRFIPTEVTLVRIDYAGRRMVVAYLWDLRELKKIESERDRERQLLQSTLNTSPVCFAIIVDGEARFVTPYMSNFIGIDVGQRLSDYFVDENEARLLREELDENGIINWLPVVLRTKNGDRKDMLANMFFIDYYDSEAVMVWLIDVTQIRKVESELRLARDAAETSARTKSEFLANMSHEIRTPMNAILGMTHLALRTDLTPKQTEYLQGVEQSAKLLLRIINDILDFSKIEAGRMVMEYHEFSLDEILDDLHAMLIGSAKNKGLELDFDVRPDVPRRLMGDSVRLLQVLMNLINNAIKFTSAGSVLASIDVLEQDGLSVELEFTVRDTGIGMTANQMRTLFKPFSQADTSTTRKYGGTGLGLAISKSLVEMMKGTISCRSELGKGTVFTFNGRFGLPLEGDVLQDVSEIRTDALLLGDREDSIGSIRRYLELLKCKVVAQCETVEEFLAFLDEDRLSEIDFIIFDYDELVGKGLPIFRLLREKFGDRLPPVAISWHPEVDFVLGEIKPTRPVQVIQEPVVVSELFNLMMTVTTEKKEFLRRQHEKERKNEESGRRSASDYGIPDSIRGARILLAEDNRVNQIVASEMLQMEGFVVEIAGTGSQAVDMIRKNDYDLVLMDIQMPEMDGLEASRLIRSDSRFDHLPILAMTAHAMTGDREQSLEAGMNDHITKPIDPALLFSTMVKWIRR